MINKLSSNVRLPLELVRGNILQRSQKAGALVEELNTRSKKLLKDANITLEKIQDIVDDTFPKNICISVVENDDDFGYAANSFLIDSNTNRIIGTTLELSTNNGIFPKEHFVDILHEGRHIADGLYNPKYYSRFQTMDSKNLLSTKYYNTYYDEIYIRECIEGKKDKNIIISLLERKLHKLLKGMKISDKIDTLQYTRYNLESEQNAFNTQLKYAKELERKGLVMEDDRDADYIEEFMFDEKIKLLKKMAFSIIKKERKEHASKLAKKEAKAKTKSSKKLNKTI